MTNAALHVARTGLDAQQERMRVIANNISNVNTTGFKRDSANFQTLAYQYMTQPGATSSGDDKYTEGLSLGSGVKITGTSRSDTRRRDEHDRRLARRHGPGRGLLPDPAARRHHRLHPRRQFHGLAGRPDHDAGRPRAGAQYPDAAGLYEPHDRRRRHRVGRPTPNSTAATQLGKIQLASFVNPSGLQSIGDNLLTETQASGTPQLGDAGIDGRGTILQGTLEASNVDVTQELVDMIETQRAYEVNSKMIKATDEMLQFANQNM